MRFGPTYGTRSRPRRARRGPRNATPSTISSSHARSSNAAADGGGLLEWREYNGNLYGTPRDYIERTLARGDDLIVKPEVNGALAIKRAYPEAVLIFLAPDGFAHLRSRLVARGTDSGIEIENRLAIAREELKFAENFDYLIVNEQGRMDAALSSVAAILEAEHCRMHRYDEGAIARLQSE